MGAVFDSGGGGNALGGCPVCGSCEVTGDAWDMETDVRRGVVSAWQSVTCDDCGSAWDDVYELRHRENVRRGNRVGVSLARQGVGVSDWLDMAYEDRTACDDMGGVL